MKTVIVTGTTKSPITLEEIKDHLRIERGETFYDDSLKGMRSAAIEMVENVTGRKLMPQTWRAYFDDWPRGEYMEIPYPPLRSVESTDVLYTNSTGDTTTFNLTGSSSSWSVDIVSEPGRVVLDNSEDWPTDILHQNNPISVEFGCGYAGSTAIPQSIKHAMYLMIGHWFEMREETLTGATVQQIPVASRALLAPYRISKF